MFPFSSDRYGCLGSLLISIVPTALRVLDLRSCSR